jgi:hypothetical protein
VQYSIGIEGYLLGKTAIFDAFCLVRELAGDAPSAPRLSPAAAPGRRPALGDLAGVQALHTDHAGLLLGALRVFRFARGWSRLAESRTHWGSVRAEVV